MQANTLPKISMNGSNNNRRPLQKSVYEKPCIIKSQCQSCRFINENYERSLKSKYQKGIDLLNAEQLLQGVKVVEPHKSPNVLNYRTTLKLAVRKPLAKMLMMRDQVSERFAIGLFKPNTHDIVDIGSCPLHVPVLRKLLWELKALLEESSLQPWDESKQTGDIRYIVAKSSHLTQEIMLTFIVGDELCKKTLISISRELKTKGLKVNSVHININAGEGNQIFGEKTIHIAGNKKLRESLCDFQLEIGPSSFLQINPGQAQNIYRRISQLVSLPQSSRDACAWDLYCGVGIISLTLAKSGYRVIGIEENSAAIADAQANKEKNGLSSPFFDFIDAKVEDSFAKIPSWAAHPKVVVVNPSRRGLDAKVREKLCELSKGSDIEQLIYVSCDLASLMRDLKELVSAKFKLRQVEAYDMFAQTDKLEWLAVLTR